MKTDRLTETSTCDIHRRFCCTHFSNECHAIGSVDKSGIPHQKYTVPLLSCMFCPQEQQPAWMQKHKTMKNYMKSLYSQSVRWFHFCRKVTDWNICLHGMQWGLQVELWNTEDTTRSSTTLPTSHTISMHTFSQHIGREGEKMFAVQKEFTNSNDLYTKITTTRGRKRDRLQTRKNTSQE